MRPLVAATVTLDELKTFFKGEYWTPKELENGGLEAAGKNYYKVKFEPGGSPAYAVKVHAYEDNSDSDEAVTDNPTKFLSDFLKTGTAGDEALQKMASALEPVYQDRYVPPVVVSNLLRAWAISVEAGEIGPKTLSRLVRRASLLLANPMEPGMGPSLHLLASLVRLAAREQIEAKEMQKLADQMSEKGWKAKAGKNDRGFPELTVDIAGVYEALIEVDHMPWKYSFEVYDHPDTLAEGITDDPIGEYQRYYKTEKVQMAKAELKGKKEAPQTEGTIPAAPKSKKKPPVDGGPHGDYESGAPS